MAEDHRRIVIGIIARVSVAHFIPLFWCREKSIAALTGTLKKYSGYSCSRDELISSIHQNS
jgi:hypothetical protein